MSNELLSFVLEHEQFRKARLPSLYSDFRYLRTTNPNGFAANVSAWKSVLGAATQRGLVSADRTVLHSGEELVGRLATREWGRPLALGTVVGEAVASRELYPLELFLGQSYSIYYSSWMGTLLTWGLEKLGLKSPAGATDARVLTGKYVVVRNVEEAAKEILAKVAARPNRVGRTYTAEHFAEEFTPGFSATDRKVLTRFLSRDLGEASYDGTTIKFRSAQEALTAINETDTSIGALKALVRSVQQRVDVLSADIAACDAKARAGVAAKNRVLALAALRSKKIAEEALRRQVGSLAQVEEVLMRIEQAADNVELVRQLEGSEKVLRALNKEVGGVDRVDRVMDALREETGKVEEVNRVIGEAGPDVDELEVEDEFESLLREEEEKREEKRERERKKEKVPLPEMPHVLKGMENALPDELGELGLNGSDTGPPVEKDQNQENAEPVPTS